MTSSHRIRTSVSVAAFVLLGTLWGAGPGLTLTKEAAIEECRNTVGRPIVQGCVRGGGGNIEACRAVASPKVKACVLAALNAANGRANVAVPVPKDAPETVVDSASAAPAAFVAPPRTIADIAAILDSEKPDPAKIEAIRAAADAAPPA